MANSVLTEYNPVLQNKEFNFVFKVNVCKMESHVKMSEHSDCNLK